MLLKICALALFPSAILGDSHITSPASKPELTTANGAFKMSVNGDKDISFQRRGQAELSVFEMQNQIESLKAALVETQQNATMAQLAFQESIDDMRSSILQSINGLDLKIDGVGSSVDELGNTVQSNKEENDGAIVKANRDSQTAIEAVDNSMQSKLTGVSKTLSKALTAVDAKTTVNEANIISKPIHMWSGGTRSSMYGSGWAEIKADRIEIDNAAPFFQRSTASRFRALKSGLFKIEVNYLSYCSRGLRLHELNVNNKVVHRGTYKYAEQWNDNRYSVTWHIKAGQTFYNRAYINCGSTKLYGSTKSDGAYNRYQVTYLGVLNPKVKCSTQFGMC